MQAVLQANVSVLRLDGELNFGNVGAVMKAVRAAADDTAIDRSIINNPLQANALDSTSSPNSHSEDAHREAEATRVVVAERELLTPRDHIHQLMHDCAVPVAQAGKLRDHPRAVFAIQSAEEVYEPRQSAAALHASHTTAPVDSSSGEAAASTSSQPVSAGAGGSLGGGVSCRAVIVDGSRIVSVDGTACRELQATASVLVEMRVELLVVSLPGPVRDMMQRYGVDGVASKKGVPMLQLLSIQSALAFLQERQGESSDVWMKEAMGHTSTAHEDHDGTIPEACAANGSGDANSDAAPMASGIHVGHRDGSDAGASGEDAPSPNAILRISRAQED